MTWTLTDHVCKTCLGRVLASTEADVDGPLRYVCAQCEEACGSKRGSRYIPMCACAEHVGGKQVMACERYPTPKPHGYPVVTARMQQAEASSAPRQPRYAVGAAG